MGVARCPPILVLDETPAVEAKLLPFRSLPYLYNLSAE